jgi:hypothetical protein
LRVGHHNPGNVALTDIDAPGAEPRQAFDLELMVVASERSEIEMDSVLTSGATSRTAAPEIGVEPRLSDHCGDSDRDPPATEVAFDLPGSGEVAEWLCSGYGPDSENPDVYCDNCEAVVGNSAVVMHAGQSTARRRFSMATRTS